MRYNFLYCAGARGLRGHHKCTGFCVGGACTICASYHIICTPPFIVVHINIICTPAIPGMLPVKNHPTVFRHACVCMRFADIRYMITYMRDALLCLIPPYKTWRKPLLLTVVGEENAGGSLLNFCFVVQRALVPYVNKMIRCDSFCPEKSARWCLN